MNPPNAPSRHPAIGAPVERVDARLKVTGQARYPDDEPVPHPAYAWLVTSTIARGRIASIDLGAARAVPGVLDVLTHENAASVKPLQMFSQGGTGATSIAPLSSPQVHHHGQIVAMVVAETFEAAREAAHRVGVRYAAETPAAGFDAPGATRETAAEASKQHRDPAVGDAERAYAGAEVRIEGRYATPTQHHNPIELFSTTCTFHGDELTIDEPSQFVYGLKNGVAESLGIDPARVHVRSRYVGGAFGSKGSVTPRTALVALAAQRVGRPVKLVMTRQQAYANTTYRAETRHRVRLGATRSGKLVAYLHEGEEVSSRPDSYFVAGTASTSRLYAYGAVATQVSVVHADRNTPGFMRSPPEVPYVFALETALDEMAVALAMDPVEFRRRNDTQRDPVTGKPYSSRSLMACYDEAARAFGWRQRIPRPGAMTDGDWLVGWGCATATYPTHIAPACARVRLMPDGRAEVEIAAHDVGTGTYTVVAQTVAAELGLAVEAVQVRMGDTRLPAAPVSGGSNVTASTTSVLLQACGAIRQRLFAAAVRRGPLAGSQAAGLQLRQGAIAAADGRQVPLQQAFEAAGIGRLEEYAEFVPPGKTAADVQKLYRGRSAIGGGSEGEKMMFAFGAEFVEVRIHRLTREIRVPRIVGAFAAGRIVNARTARSQLMGGMIWGIGSALHEATEVDPRTARYLNDDIAEYLVPVNADVPRVDVILVPETDTFVNPMGVKGIGELGNVGTAAALSNAVFHATGRRIRELPIRIEHLL